MFSGDRATDPRHVLEGYEEKWIWPSFQRMLMAPDIADEVKGVIAIFFEQVNLCMFHALAVLLARVAKQQTWHRVELALQCPACGHPALILRRMDGMYTAAFAIREGLSRYNYSIAISSICDIHCAGNIFVYFPTYFIATPPDRGWQRNEGLLLLHSFLSLDILVAFSILRFGTSAKSVS